MLFGFLWQALFTGESFDYLSIVGALFVTGSIFIIIAYKRAQIAKASSQVDAIKDGDVINYEIVENPMDLSTRTVEGEEGGAFEYKVIMSPVQDAMEIELTHPKYINGSIAGRRGTRDWIGGGSGGEEREEGGVGRDAVVIHRQNVESCKEVVGEVGSARI